VWQPSSLRSSCSGRRRHALRHFEPHIQSAQLGWGRFFFWLCFSGCRAFFFLQL